MAFMSLSQPPVASEATPAWPPADGLAVHNATPWDFSDSMRKDAAGSAPLAGAALSKPLDAAGPSLFAPRDLLRC